MKKNYIASNSAVIAAIMAISLLISGIFTAVSSEKHIEESLVRLHILANSDSELDQQLKLRVRDAVLASSDELFEPYSSSEEAEEALSGQLDKIKAIADSTLAENGCDDRTVCEITSMDIDRREYGEYTVPAGRYTALRITIGEGKGLNWWCVMYPTLCFVDSTYQIVPGESKEKLKKCLTEEEYNSLLDGENGIETSSLFIEWIRNILFS